MIKLKLFLAASLTLLGLSLAAAPGAAAYNPLGSVCSNAPTNPVCTQNKTQNGSTTNPALNTIRTATNLIAIIAGIGAVIIIIISGFMFITAGGEPNAVKKARSALLGAIIGLVIIALAWTIVTFATDHFVKT